MKLINSIKILTEPPKSRIKYDLLYKNGYIYQWSLKMAIKRLIKNNHLL